MLKFPNIITDRMVLQRERYVHLWGEGKGKVFAKIAGIESCAWSYDGAWQLVLPPLPVGGPYTLTVSDEEETVSFTDVLVGDVFLAGGQSNMEHPLFCAEGGFEAAKCAANDRIRLFDVPRPKTQSGDEFRFAYASTDPTPWQYCTEKTALEFSAIGYWFAEKLQKAENIPVGIIHCSYGGTNIETWLPRERMFSTPGAELVRKNHIDWLAQLDVAEQKKSWDYFVAERARRGKSVDAIRIARDRGILPVVTEDICGLAGIPEAIGGPFHGCWAGVLYDQMLKPLAPYSLKGVLWYQGENNAIRGAECYSAIMETLVKSWRWAFDDEKLPFFTVQLAPFASGTEEGWCEILQQQLDAAKRIPDVYLITTSDLGEKDNIHPLKKEKFAQRLFVAAESVLYGKNNEYCGPIAESAVKAGDTVTVTFSHAKCLSCDSEISELFVTDKNGREVPVKAKIDGNRLVIKAPDAVTVKMGFAPYHEINLYNQDGLIASPFCLPAEETAAE